MLFEASFHGELKPDVRMSLWMRSSGAIHLMKRADKGVTSQNTEEVKSRQSYFSSLVEIGEEESKLDVANQKFDLMTTRKLEVVKTSSIGQLLDQKTMQRRLQRLIQAYSRHDPRFSVSDQNKVKIMVKILETVFEEETAFWLVCALQSITPSTESHGETTSDYMKFLVQ